jgi:predicted dienelactone hydrolase
LKLGAFGGVNLPSSQVVEGNMHMNNPSQFTDRSLLPQWAWLLCLLGTLFAPAVMAIAPPPLVGSYPVACSNVEQDFTRLRSGESAPDYWEGNPLIDGSKYVTDLLVSPNDALTYKVTVPAKSEIDVFERHGGQQLQYAAYVCYPTTAANARADYVLPDGTRVPKMQRGSEAPLIAANAAAADGKWPLLVLSHGLAGSPLGDSYVPVIVRLAAEGYVVFAPFHADARYSKVKLNDLSDYFYVLTKYSEIAEMQAIRPLGLKQGLDYLLSKPEYANAIDADQIAGFGASLGGMAMMLAQGSKMTTSWGGAERTIVRDNRYKAVVGYVPFSGYSFQPAFGDSNQGVKSVRVPYLGIGGTADIVAPISRTSQMIAALGGSKYFVTIQDMPHGLRAQDAPELFGWTFAFLKAHLSRNQADRDAFQQIVNFDGNADDRVQLRKTLAWGSRDELEVIEYVVPSIGKYFITGRADEMALLDTGKYLWQRSGLRYVTFRLDAPIGSPMCRFWINDGRAMTHFYSVSTADCDLVRQQWWANDEGFVMKAQAQLFYNSIAPGPPCPDDMTPMIRWYNSAIVNHRYMPLPMLERFLPPPGYVNEGVAFCAVVYKE